ncbi:MAG: sigma-70 family RNA polymerase sigma factor [Oscillospiraceae bacterium]|nr:sigma-70 family RNA polymerase sigma factor [Oscillospiraceae bacterium]
MSYLSDNDIRQYGKMISILSNRMISNKEIAMEAAQEVWVEVIKSLPSFRNESKLSTFIYIIAKRVISRYAAKERQYSLEFLHQYITGEDRELPEEIGDVEKDIWIKEECDRCLTGLFHCLTGEARLTYLFRDVIGLDYAEIAGIMEQNRQYIRKSVSRSRLRLKNFLNNDCRIFNPGSSCSCRMHRLLNDIDLPHEYKRIRELSKDISILKQAEMVLPSKNYWEKYLSDYN